MKRLTVIALTLFVCSCDKAPQQKQPETVPTPSPFRAPTATELFELQSKCTVLGEKIMRENVIGSALTQQQTSHYNPKDNRCYVKLDVSTADLTTPSEKYIEDEYLYDGQSNEMLAALTYQGEKKSGIVYDSSLEKLMQEKKQSTENFDAVRDLIDSFVATDRRQ
jgi:hypothetical protein